MFKKDDFKKLIKKFNNQRYPECFAKILDSDLKNIKVEFSGTAAPISCCFDEHFNDLIYLVRDNFDIDLNILEIEREGYNKFLVTYNILKKEE